MQLITGMFFVVATAANAEAAQADVARGRPMAGHNPESVAHASKPNIIYILLDDTGFGDLGSFGSEIATPNLDRLAAEGLRYNAFHTRAICSPSRAALLTGRNSHSVGMGNLTNVVTDAPGKRGEISHAAATIAEVLRPAGYSTFAVGKWHLAPMSAAHGANDKSQWPLQRGFDQYFGFIGGMADQFHPELVMDNTLVPAPKSPDYHFTTDMVDRSIGLVQAVKARDPEQPFFLYFAPGATHAPHQAPARFIDRYNAVYAEGWDRIRAKRFARQKQFGLIPKNTRLPPRNSDVKPWDSLSRGEKKVAARLQAAYAGFLEHTDAEIGRLLTFLDRAGLRNDTIIVVMSDNGASPEGEAHGTTNLTFSVANTARATEALDDLVRRLPQVGSDRTYSNYPLGWAMVSNTPFTQYKQSVNEGGLRAPLIVSWPKGIQKKGAVRPQFVDIIDITPTILDVVDVEVPTSFRGVAQQPLEGASIAATFADPAAPEARRAQYFELWGQRAVWHEGWKATALHIAGQPFETDAWALYNQRNDFSASRNVAGRHPQIVAKLKETWLQEAKKYNVLPLDDRGLRDPAFHKALKAPNEYRYFAGTQQIPSDASPRVLNKSFAVTAFVDRKDLNAEGVLIASGDRFGGYVFYVKENRLHFDFNDFGKHLVVTSSAQVPIGQSQLGYRFERTGDFVGRGTLTIDGRSVGSMELKSTPTVSISWSSTDIGLDVGSPVSDAYAEKQAFAFPKEQLKEVVVNTD
ncbi:arylsulfatase [Sphingobium herbicidovorans]|nr:arylsulfatase [Sphingobium herbicidovorans]